MNISYRQSECVLANGQWKTVSDVILVHFILLALICCTTWESSTLSILTSVEVAWNPHPHMSTHDNLVCIRTIYVYMSVIQGIYFPDVVIYLQSNCCHISNLSLSLAHFTSIPMAGSSTALRGDDHRQLFPWTRSPSVLTPSLFTALLTPYFHTSLIFFSSWKAVGKSD